MSPCVILSRACVLNTNISFCSWIALFIAWNLPSVIIRRVSEDLSSAEDLQPRTWALWCAPCFIVTSFPIDSK